MKKILFVFTFILSLLNTANLFADTSRENRDYIAKRIELANGTKAMTLTKNFGMLAVYKKFNVAAGQSVKAHESLVILG